MVRRRIAAVVAVVVLLVVVFVISNSLSSNGHQALERYAQDINQVVGESDQQVGHPLFTALSGASSKSALDVEQQVDRLRGQAQDEAAHAAALTVPSAMAGTQQNLVLMLDLRSEGVTKVASLLGPALGGHGTQASTEIAGAMELFLSSDVVYSQRVVPLAEETLAASSIAGQTIGTSAFLPNLGWLMPETVLSRVSGGSSASTQSGALAPGTHGSALTGVSIGGTALEPPPALNHLGAGSTQTVTAAVENSGTNRETNVHVAVTVEIAGKQLKASKTISETQPGKTVDEEVPVKGIPQGLEANITVNVQAVPGETNLANNKESYMAVFGT